MTDNRITAGKGFAAALIVVTAFLVAGCASSGPGRDINDPTSSLVFAYIDMEDAPTDMEYATLHQVAPKAEAGYWSMSVEDGLAYHAYLPVGAYQLANFGGSGFLSGAHEYSFPNYGRNQTAASIEVPGIFFLGAYRYQEVDTGFFEQGKFSMEPLPSPGEAELLRRLSRMQWVKGTQWEKRIQARLAELDK